LVAHRVRVRIREMGGIDARSGPDCLGMSGSMQGAGRTVWGCRETLPCLLTFSSGSTGDKSGRSRRRTGERAGLFELRRCMMVVAASRGRRFVTVCLLTLSLPHSLFGRGKHASHTLLVRCMPGLVCQYLPHPSHVHHLQYCFLKLIVMAVAMPSYATGSLTCHDLTPFASWP
jgi:hypothetical protein